MGLWIGDRQVSYIDGEGTDPPLVGSLAVIGGFTIYVDSNGNLNILAPDNTVVPLVLSGSGPPVPL